MAALTLSKRFLRAPLLYQTALNDGLSALEQFESYWDQLGLDFERELQSSNVEYDDLLVAHAASLQIKSLSNAVSEMQQTASSITSTVVSEIGDMLSILSIADAPSPYPFHRQITPSTFPPYIKGAFTWLVNNLHDPYPSPKEKRTLSETCVCSSRVLEQWFKSMRRCIGWTDLCKKHFSGSRTRAREAGYEVLVSCKVDTLSPDVVADFLAMQSALQNLYIEERDYDDIVTSPSPICAPTPYSRPHSSLSQHSTTPSLVSSASDESEEEESFPEPFLYVGIPPSLPPAIGGHKLEHPTYESLFDPPRNCGHYEPPLSMKPIIPPSFTISESADFGTPTISPATKRKRRLSDVGMDTIRKRPVIALPARAVSDPLPYNVVSAAPNVEDIISEWLKDDYSSIFQIPKAVDTEPIIGDLGWDTASRVQPSATNDTSESCDQWSSLVSESCGMSPLESSVSSPAVVDIMHESSFEDLWVPLFDIPEPALEPEPLTLGPILHNQPSTINEFSSSTAWSGELEDLVNLLGLPLESSPSIL